MGTQKNRFNETVLFHTQNICLNLWVRRYLQIYADFFVYLNLWVTLIKWNIYKLKWSNVLRLT